MEERKKRILICDSCRHRKACGGQAFPCGFVRTRGDQLVDDLGHKGIAMDKYDTSKYIIFSQIITHEHADPINPPEWLDIERNTCLHFINDKFDIADRFNVLGNKHFDQSDVWWD